MKALIVTLNIFTSILVVVYPFIIYYCVIHHLYEISAAILALILILKVFLGGKRKLKENLSLLVIGGFLCAFFTYSHDFIYLKLYPILVNIVMLFIFGSTLFTSRSLVEMLASIKTPIEQQDQDFKHYCKHVTIAWCYFFIFNGLMATITALWCSHKIWAFYTGFISYFLIALMFVVEYIYRNYRKKRRGV